jgi:hypothetical protein
MSVWRRIVIAMSRFGLALVTMNQAFCGSGDIVYHPDHDAGVCDAGGGGAGGTGGSGGGCP